MWGLWISYVKRLYFGLGDVPPNSEWRAPEMEKVAAGTIFQG